MLNLVTGDSGTCFGEVHQRLLNRPVFNETVSKGTHSEAPVPCLWVGPPAEIGRSWSIRCHDAAPRTQPTSHRSLHDAVYQLGSGTNAEGPD